jgi:hypothetical protein
MTGTEPDALGDGLDGHYHLWVRRLRIPGEVARESGMLLPSIPI